MEYLMMSTCSSSMKRLNLIMTKCSWVIYLLSYATSFRESYLNLSLTSWGMFLIAWRIVCKVSHMNNRKPFLSAEQGCWGTLKAEKIQQERWLDSWIYIKVYIKKRRGKERSNLCLSQLKNFLEASLDEKEGFSPFKGGKFNGHFQ